MPAKEPWTITRLNEAIRDSLHATPDLQSVHVVGEVSRVYRAQSGHLYFALKDEAASIKAVLWRSRAIGQEEHVQEGAQVEAWGRVTLYLERGETQIDVHAVRPAGAGALAVQLEKLRKKLQAEGLFEPARKRPLPRLPARVAIVTSRDAAALRDVLRVLRKRAPWVEARLEHTLVQGPEAPPAIVAALERAAGRGEVVLLVRGGGSLEDLWSFNDERVVRAIAASAVPVVTGVGHEVDWTLADFVADQRGATPTQAMEIVLDAWVLAIEGLDAAPRRLARGLGHRLETARADLATQTHRLDRSLVETLRGAERFLDEAQPKLGRALERALVGARHRHERAAELLARAGAGATLERGLRRLERDAGVLDALSPLAVLGRGYAVATAEGRAVRDAAGLKPGQGVTVRLHRGRFDSRVERVYDG